MPFGRGMLVAMVDENHEFCSSGDVNMQTCRKEPLYVYVSTMLQMAQVGSRNCGNDHSYRWIKKLAWCGS